MSSVEQEHLRTIRELAAQVDRFAERSRIALPRSAADLDRLLDVACDSSEDETLRSLAIAIGLRLGELLVEHHGARWVGFREPVPPRIELRARFASPIDLVERRIESPEAPTLAAAVDSWLAVADTPVFDRTATLAHNRSAWSDLSSDSRFAASTMPKLDRDQAQRAIDPWIRDAHIEGKRLLLLGGAGGTHAALYAMAGATVTVVDLSSEQLALDRAQAAELGLDLQLIAGSADDLTMLQAESFEIAVQPVLSSYLSDVALLYRQVHRVLRSGGVYLSQHKLPEGLRAAWNPRRERYELAPRTESLGPIDDDSAAKCPLREAGTIEFAHSLGSLLGDLCLAGFVIEGFDEPLRADFWAPAGSIAHLAETVSPYCRVKARRIGRTGLS